MNETAVAAGIHSITYGTPGIINICGHLLSSRVFNFLKALTPASFGPLYSAPLYILHHLDIYEQDTQSYM